MKNWILILSLLLVASCKKEQVLQTPIQVADNFIKHFYISDSYNIKNVNQFMTPEFVEKYKSLSTEHKKIHESYIKGMMNEIRQTLKENNYDYELVRLKELNEKDLKTTIIYYGNGEVLILKTRGEVLIMLIVEKNKIYSFCPDMYLSTKKRAVPYFFFDEEKLKKPN